MLQSLISVFKFFVEMKHYFNISAEIKQFEMRKTTINHFLIVFLRLNKFLIKSIY